MESKSKSKSEVQVQMTHGKSTKNYEQYLADDPASVLKNVYLEKAAFPDGRPTKITVTVAATD